MFLKILFQHFRKGYLFFSLSFENLTDTNFIFISTTVYIYINKYANLNKCLDPVGILDLERLIEHCFEQTETLRFRGIVDNLNYYFDVILNKRQRQRKRERRGKKNFSDEKISKLRDGKAKEMESTA